MDLTARISDNVSDVAWICFYVIWMCYIVFLYDKMLKLNNIKFFFQCHYVGVKRRTSHIHPRPSGKKELCFPFCMSYLGIRPILFLIRHAYIYQENAPKSNALLIATIFGIFSVYEPYLVKDNDPVALSMINNIRQIQLPS